jgi:hypothetical protein
MAAQSSSEATSIHPVLEWKIDGPIAIATLRDYHLQVDTADPRRGVQWTTETKQSFRGPTLQFIAPPSAKGNLQLADLYVRGRDLVATYEQLPGAEVQPTLYWRLLHHTGLNAIGVELLISMQTSRLDSHPQCAVESALPGVRTSAWDMQQKLWHYSTENSPKFDVQFTSQAQGSVTWFSAPKEHYSYVEVAYPDDLISQHITLGRCETCFFAEHLEKGVIRRGRIAGWITPNQSLMSGPAAVFDLLEAAYRAPLPLTT